MPDVHIHDIQGNVLRGYAPNRLPRARYVFIAVRDGGSEEARAWLRGLISQVARSGASDEAGFQGTPGRAVNIAFTHAGLARLGVPGRLRERFSEAFTAGMVARGDLLADPPPELWDDAGWQRHEADIDICLMLHDGPPPEGTPDPFADILHGLPASLRVLFTETGLRLRSPGDPDGPYGAYDHFGFVDGISQPWVKDVPYRDGQGKRLGHRERDGVRPIAAGEFLFGYENEGGETPPISRAHLADGANDDFFAALVRNGTYMVWRKLEQDVDAFERFVEEHAEHLLAAEGLQSSPERARAFFKAKIVGRWPDGTPLAVAPTPDQWTPGLAQELGDAVNDFWFRDDPDGLACPLGAHVRRASPRDMGAADGSLTKRRHIIRRGIPYVAPRDGSDAHVRRGLYFVALCTNIAGQFELIQRQWISHGDFVEQGADRDPLVAPRGPYEQQFVVPGRKQPYIARGLPQFVTLRGGAYFFLPGIEGLRRIAEGFDPVSGVMS